ncbi:hypothetical protein YC2023_117022 [Brassica napus]
MGETYTSYVVIFLDKGNRFSDGKRVNRMIGSELGLVNGYKWSGQVLRFGGYGSLQRGVAERALWCYENVQDGVVKVVSDMKYGVDFIDTQILSIITTHFGTAVVGSDIKSSIVEWSFKLLTLRAIFGKGSLLENVFIDMVNC